MYHTEPRTDKTIREWYMNSSRVAACALQNEQAATQPHNAEEIQMNVMHSSCVLQGARSDTDQWQDQYMAELPLTPVTMFIFVTYVYRVWRELFQYD